MGSDDTFADYLENGSGDELQPDHAARLERLRSMLNEEAMWEEPPPGIGELVAQERATGGRPGWWGWAAAVAALVVTTIGLANLPTDESEASVVASISMSGTDLAPDAVGTAGLIPLSNGWAIDFDVEGLPPAEEGTYYQAWVNNGEDAVSVGTFHMRGDEATPIALWSGVDLEEYRTLNVTIQEEGGGQLSSGILVVTGTAADFE